MGIRCLSPPTKRFGGFLAEICGMEATSRSDRTCAAVLGSLGECRAINQAPPTAEIGSLNLFTLLPGSGVLRSTYPETCIAPVLCGRRTADIRTRIPETAHHIL